MNTRKLRLSAILLFLMSAGALQAMGSSETVNRADVNDVVMFTNGTSLVSYVAEVSGDGSLSLPVASDDMLDILKTLVVRDLDGGVIVSAGFTAKDPVDRTLGRMAVNMSGSPGVRDLLIRSPGAEVRIATGGSMVTGRIMGLENRNTSRGGGEQLNLLVQGRIVSIPLQEILSFSFTDPALREDMDKAMDLIRDASSGERKTINIEYRGTGTRRIVIGYLRPSPVWKPSYRLFANGDSTVVQGWAIVENTSADDWRNVGLSLSTANPVSFVMDLYTPRYISRPTLQPPGLSAAQVPTPLANQSRVAAAEPQSYARSAAPSAMATESGMDFYDDEAYSKALTSTAPARASAVSSGSLARSFAYRLDEPVSLNAQSSAMVPIVNTEMNVLSYNSWRSDTGTPVYRTLELHNDSGYFLAAGPLAIYDEGQFAGEAVLSFLAPGGEQRIEYAVEDSLSVSSSGGGNSDVITGISVSKGVLQTSTSRVRTVNYLIDNNGAEEKELHLFHRRQSGWNISSDTPFADAGGYAEYKLPVPPGKSVGLTVSEETTVSRSYQLLNLQDSSLQVFYASGVLSSEQENALKKISDYRSAVTETQNQLSLLNNEQSAIYREQERIVRNMDSLEKDSALYNRYVTSLNQQENRLEELTGEINTARQELSTRQTALSDYIISLEF